MKKIFLGLFIMCLFLFGLTACKKEEVTKIENTKDEIAEFTKKYLEIFNQENNAFIILKFKNKDFLPGEMFNKTKVFDPQKKLEENLGDFDFYTLIISCQDNLNFRFQKKDYEKEDFEDIFYSNLQRGEALLFLNYTDMEKLELYSNLIVNKSEHTEEKIEAWLGSFKEIPEVYFFKKYFTPNKDYLLQKEEKSNILYAQGDIDLNGDGKKNQIKFSSDRYYNDIEYIKEFIAHLKIDENSFNLRNLIENIPFENTWEKEALLDFPIVDIEILDLSSKDNKKEIILRLKDEGAEADTAFVFDYDNNELNYLGMISYGEEENLASCFNPEIEKLFISELNDLYSFYHWQVLQMSYYLSDNKIIKELPVGEMNTNNSRLISRLEKNIHFYKDKKFEEIYSQEKEKRTLLLLESDYKSWIKAKDIKTGEIGYLAFKRTEDFSFIPHKQEELGALPFEEILSDLYFLE